MAINYGTNLGLMIDATTGEAHDAALRALLRGLDALVMPVVKGVGTNTPPGSPANGDVYVVGTSPTGAWAAKNNQIARWSSVANAWEFYVPKAGWRVVDSSATGQPQYTFTGSAWTTLITTEGGINLGQTDLKNYQEGTFTPVLTAQTAPSGVAYLTRIGQYTRIGNTIFVRIGICLSSKGTGGYGVVRITGLPFAAGSFSIYSEPQTRCSMVQNLVTAAYAPAISFFTRSSDTTIEGRIVQNGDIMFLWTEITDTSAFVLEMFYNV